MTMIITLLAIGFVIFFHELGHMLAAKRSGIGVMEFAVGMGPKLFGKRIGETLYTLRAFPLGGFVKLAGIDDEEAEPTDPEKSFYEKPLSARFLTISAGSLMNILLGFLIFLGLGFFVGEYVASNRILEVMKESPAMQAGLLSGDRIIEVNGQRVLDVQADAIQVIQNAPDTPIKLGIDRAGEIRMLTIIPRANDAGHGIIGVRFDTAHNQYRPDRAIQYAAGQTVKYVAYVFVSLKMLFSNEVGFSDMAGPIGILQFASAGLQKSVANFFNLMAMISISLGVINLFPFPVLDGGHLMFLTIEAIRRKRLSTKWETLINNSGAAVLIVLMVLIVVNDIVHWQERIDVINKLLK